MGLPDGEEIITPAFFVLIQYRLVTDGRTDGQTDGHVTIAITREGKNDNTTKDLQDQFGFRPIGSTTAHGEIKLSTVG